MRVCPRCGAVYITNVPWCGIDGEALVHTEQDPLVGRAIERYEIVERLGMGGMGCVYAAKHAVIERDYAIKVLFGDFAGDDKFRARFKREAQSISKIRHPNIVQVEDFGTTSNGLTFLAMELVRGRTLEDVIDHEAPMSPTRAAGIVRQIAAGLQAAHELGFVHRDVKPSNVMLLKTDAYDGEFVKILDFGAVSLRAIPMEERLTTIGHIIGTPAYMAPEQTQDPGVGPTADLYALGCVLFEMLAGTVPFTGNTRAEVMVQHITERAPPAPPSRGLEEIVRRLMAKHPEDRLQSGAEVVAAIEALKLGLPPLPSGILPRRPSYEREHSLSSAEIEQDAFHSAPTNHMLLDGFDGPSEDELFAAARAEQPTPPSDPVLGDTFPALAEDEDEHDEWGSTWGAAETVDPDSVRPRTHLVDDDRGTQPVPVPMPEASDTGPNATLIVRERGGETGKIETSDLVITPNVGIAVVNPDALDQETEDGRPLPDDMLYEPARPGDGPIVDEAGPTQVDFRMEYDMDPAMVSIDAGELSEELGFDHRPPMIREEASLDTSSVVTEPPNEGADPTLLPDDDYDLGTVESLIPETLPPNLVEPVRLPMPPAILGVPEPPRLDSPDVDTADPIEPTIPSPIVGEAQRLPERRVSVPSHDAYETADGQPAVAKATSILPVSQPRKRSGAFYPIAIVLLLIVIAMLGSLVYARYSAPSAAPESESARRVEATNER